MFDEPLIPVINRFYRNNFLNYVKDKSSPVEWVHEPEAKPLGLQGYDDIDLFIVKEIKDDGAYWRISESYTGTRIYMSDEPESKGDAMQNAIADMNIHGFTQDKLKTALEAFINKHGLSPRYKK